MRRKGQKDLVHEQNMLEVINDTFTIQKVHCYGKEVPIQRPRQWEVLLLGRDLGNVDDLFEADDLDGSNQEENVDMSAEHSQEETSNHCQSPYCTSDKGLFLLLILIFWNFRLLFRLHSVDLGVSRSYGTAAIRHGLVRGRRTGP